MPINSPSASAERTPASHSPRPLKAPTARDTGYLRAQIEAHFALRRHAHAHRQAAEARGHQQFQAQKQPVAVDEKKALSTAAMVICDTALATPPANVTVPAANCNMPPAAPLKSNCGSAISPMPAACVHALKRSTKPRTDSTAAGSDRRRSAICAISAGKTNNSNAARNTSVESRLSAAAAPGAHEPFPETAQGQKQKRQRRRPRGQQKRRG